MARSRKRKKKSAAQHLVGLASMGMPGPIRAIMESPSGAPLTLMLAVVLVSTGIITFQWSNGGPAISVNHDKANEVTQKVGGQVVALGNGVAGEARVAKLSDIIADMKQRTASRAAGSQADPAPSPQPTYLPPATAYLPAPGVNASFGPSSPTTITIASFNIQVFGVSKLQKPQAMAVLADVVRRFDVVAIQEVRSVDDTVLPQFVAMINSNGARYDFIIGPRLGRTTSKEQYVFLFNTDRIEVDPSSIYTVYDPHDLLHREPLVSRFRARGPPPEQAFTFSLVNIHTDPDEVDSEVDALADVFRSVQSNGSGEDDVILLGDLNASEQQFGRLATVPDFGCAIRGLMTNTRQNRMYDNIIFSGRATQEYTGRSGVLDLMSFYGLSLAEALEVSDHLPVWAEFGVYEGSRPGAIATRPHTMPR